MPKGADIIVGSVLMDNIVYADGSRRDDVPGGAGLYALAGAALFSDEAVLVTGTGRDLPKTFGPWLERNGLTTRGLRFADEHAPRNILRYIDEKTRTEAPLYGAEHFREAEPNADDIARVIEGARSLFIFRNLDPAFWTGAMPMIRRPGLVTLWEIGLDACLPENRARIERLARSVDALSINMEEARAIYGTTDEQAMIAALQAIGVSVVFLRAGARGSFVITPAATSFVPSLPVEPVDVTGGGNAFSGAALVGLADGRPIIQCAAMATAAARLAISQHGPPEAGEAAVRATARKLTAEVMAMLEQTA